MLTRSVRLALPVLLLLAAAFFVACGSESATLHSSGAGDDASGAAPEAYSGDESAQAMALEQEVTGEDGAGETDQQPPLDRKIIRTANLTLAVEDIVASVRQVEAAATSAGGFVSNSSVTSDSEDSGPQTASITIRVPADKYTATLESLRGLAQSVKAESSETSEVTEEYTDLQSRLRNLEATEAQYLTLLASATTIDDILTVQDRLNAVRAEIEQVTGRINTLDNLVELATINVALSLPAGGPSGGSSQHWATQAWETSWEASKDVAVVLGSGAIGLAVLALWVIPIVVISSLIWLLFGRRIADLVTRLRGSHTPAVNG